MNKLGTCDGVSLTNKQGSKIKLLWGRGRQRFCVMGKNGTVVVIPCQFDIFNTIFA